MTNWWIIWQISKMKQEEFLKQAERLRLAGTPSSKVGTIHIRSSFSRLMNNLGKLLTFWGSYLQNRYGHCLNAQ